jgi:large subunit ribosomal protein L2
MVDFYFHDKIGIEAKVETIEYDPYRTAYIALVCYRDGERRYVLAHKDMKVGDMIVTKQEAPLASGNRMELGHIPVGLQVYNLELIV